eukprot:3565752-Prymnesium_polylepis.2
MTDAAVQQLAILLCNVSKAPQLTKLNLSDNPLSPMSETVLNGLGRLRSQLHVVLGQAGPLADGFVCQKQLIEGLSAWPADDLKVPDTQADFYCPLEISGEGNERIKLEKGFSGSNGTSAPQRTRVHCQHAHARACSPGQRPSPLRPQSGSATSRRLSSTTRRVTSCCSS